MAMEKTTDLVARILQYKRTIFNISVSGWNIFLSNNGLVLVNLLADGVVADRVPRHILDLW